MRALALLLALFVLLSVPLSLGSCLRVSEHKITEAEYQTIVEDLSAKVDAGCNIRHSYVASYLDYWGFPAFNTIKMMIIENTYDTYFIDDLGYSDADSTLALATKVARYYIDNILQAPDGSPAFTLEELRNKNIQTDALVKAYASSVGDKYSRYYTAEAFEYFINDLSGSFAGIGVYIITDRDEKTVTVSDVLDGSAAEAAGILPGDMLIKIDGSSIDDMEIDDFTNLIKGEVGSEVNVTVLRDGAELSFTMARIPIDVSSVDYVMLDGGIVYMVISAFNDNTDEQFIKMINEIEAAGEVRGYIFDLRYNGGGYSDVAVNIISHFVPKGTNILFEEKQNGKISFKSNSNHVIDEPIVVLCNGSTASAAELFTASIRDFRNDGLLNAKIVGEVTYGKGKAQSIYPLTDGSAVVFTTALFNPPCDINFDGKGITPDDIIPLDLEGNVDNQFEHALEEIQKMINNK